MIDTHAHLNFPQLFEDLDGVVARANEAGIDRIIIPGTTVEDSFSALDISAQYDTIYAAIGIHPTDGGEATAEHWQGFEKLLESEKRFVSIGEVGLDYYHEKDPQMQKKQQDVFIKMMAIAREYAVPLIIHTRDAFSDTIELLRTHASGHPTVIHCFSGSKEEAQGFLDLGCLLSFTGMITYKKNDALREVVKMVPLERMMLETDAPFLAPEGHRGEVCEPRFVRNVAEKVAEVKGISLEDVDRITTANAEEFFRL